MVEGVLVDPVGERLLALFDESPLELRQRLAGVRVALGDDTPRTGRDALESNAADFERRSVSADEPVLPERLDAADLDVRPEPSARARDRQFVEPAGDRLQRGGADHRRPHPAAVDVADRPIPLEREVTVEVLAEPRAGPFATRVRIEVEPDDRGVGGRDLEFARLGIEVGPQVVDPVGAFAVDHLALAVEQRELPVTGQRAALADGCRLAVDPVQALHRVHGESLESCHRLHVFRER